MRGGDGGGQNYPIDLLTYPWTNGTAFVTHNVYPEEWTSECVVTIPQSGYLSVAGNTTGAGNFYVQIYVNGTSVSTWSGPKSSINTVINLSQYAGQTVTLKLWATKDFNNYNINWNFTTLTLGKA